MSCAPTTIVDPDGTVWELDLAHVQCCEAYTWAGYVQLELCLPLEQQLFIEDGTEDARAERGDGGAGAAESCSARKTHEVPHSAALHNDLPF